MIWVILLLGLSLRLISLDQSLWLDEAINTLAVKNYSLIDLITQYAKADFHPPGWFIILWFWTKLFGYSEIAVRIPSVIFGVVTIYISYLIGKKLISRELGLLAAFLLASNPLHIYYSQEARMYALAALAVSANFLLLIKLVNGEKYNMFFLIFSNILVLASDYLAYFIFPAQLIFLVILKQKEAVKKWITALLIAVLAGAWWIPVFLNQLNVGLAASANLPEWKFIVGGFDLKAIPLTFVKFIIGRISHPDKTIYGMIMFPLSILFFFLLWRGIKSMKDAYKHLILSWLLAPVILAFLISFFIPIYSYFRLLFVLPAFILLVALGILSFKSKIGINLLGINLLRYFILFAVLLIELLATSIYLFNPTYQRDDWRGMVNFLKTVPQDSKIIVHSSGAFAPLIYYGKDQIKITAALKNFPAKDLGDLGHLGDLGSSVYLIDYLVEISDPNRLVEKKLDELQFSKVETWDFHGVGFLHHYVR